MPTPYIYGQTPLEKAAITQRLWLIQQTKVGTGKVYSGPYKNPVITGNLGDKYSVTHTNAVADTTTPSYGKGTGDQIDVNDTKKGITARYNYNGGSFEDINGQPNQGSGRSNLTTLNSTRFGYFPNNEYGIPDITLNSGTIKI
jgi:hypothetical protein